MDLRPGSLYAMEEELRMLVCLQLLDVCKEKLQSNYFFFQCFKKSNVFGLCCILLPVLKVKHCQMNGESCKHPRNTLSEVDPLCMNCMLSCQGKVVPILSMEESAEN